MDNRQVRTLAMFQRVQFYVDQHPVEPSPPLLTEMLRSLAESVERTKALELEQDSALRGTEENSVRSLRQDVRHAMRSLVRIAKPLLAFAPGTDRVLQVPHARTNAAATARHAIELAAALAPHAGLLADAGYSADDLATFAEQARRLGISAQTFASARQARARATADIQREIDKGMGTVTVIEGILMRHFGPANSAKLAGWRDARRVHARMGRPRQRRNGASGDVAASPTAA